MTASNTDLVRNAAPNFATTLANSILSSDTSLNLQSATGLPTSTAITLVIDATDPVSGSPTPTLKEVVTGTLSGITVSNLLRGQEGTTAQSHASGANVVMWITANLWNDYQTSYLAQHTQAGAHKALTNTGGMTNTGGLATDTLTASGLVKASGSNPVWQYLGYQELTANSTFHSSGATPTLITNLSSLVTIPTGATAVKVTVQVPNIYTQSGGGIVTLSIYSGATSGALTTLLNSITPNVAAGTAPSATVQYIGFSPSAGAIYYSAALSANSSNGSIDTTSASKAFILAEAC